MKLGRYEIESELGRGAMGRVLLAHDPEIDRKVAIKIVQSLQGLAGADRGEARDRFLREARSAGKLLHPGIVTVFDVGEVQGTPYLAMEYVQGRTLDAYCRPDGLLPVRQAVEMVAGAAEALSYAHAAGVVHRDIKPANLMRTGESSVKIMDFGLARGAEAQVTHDGALLGTPSYMSPEQIRGRAVDGRSDLFSLGVVLYELLTGVKPFPGDSVSSVIYRVVHEQPHDAAEVNPRVPPALGRLLRRALDKRVDQRFQTGDELAAALRKIAATLDVAPGSAGGSDSGRPAGPAPPRRPAAGRSIPPSPRPTVKRSSPLPFVLAIAAVLALLAGGSYYYRKSLGFDGLFDRPPVVYQTRVTVEPAETAVTVNGEPFDPTGDGVVQFTAGGPPTTVIARHACREERHELGAEQAGGELAIVFEPVRLAYELALDGVGAEVELNGEPVGRTPV
ncbi:MAG TPA: serine/threonine-protein kinase, partial [Candidatus Polarisedimenticolaceae bacterium]|nr:serine/threonine-protein kinase [Candidatus Polarisedimenticolaceae bacterium]